MPKTKKKFDWEEYDENGNLIDILTMTRDECKKYQKEFPNHTLKEIAYTEDGTDDTW